MSERLFNLGTFVEEWRSIHMESSYQIQKHPHTITILISLKKSILTMKKRQVWTQRFFYSNNNYFFFVSVFTFLTTFFAGAFLIIFFAGLLVVAGALVTGLVKTFAAGLAIFWPRYLESSKARIGMNTILMNIIPSPYVQCFQNFSAILKLLIIIITSNNGGKRSDNAHRPDIPQSWNINTILYTGIKIPHPGSLALVNILHREIIINTITARHTTIRTIASHPKNAHSTVLIHIIASGLMFPVIAAPSSSKEKFI